MPIVDKAVLEGLSHAPLVGRWVDNTVSVAFTQNFPPGTSGVVYASYTVPDGVLAYVPLTWVLCSPTTSDQQQVVAVEVNGTPVYAVGSVPNIYVRATQVLGLVLRSGDTIVLKGSNSDTAAKLGRCCVWVEEVYI